MSSPHTTRLVNPRLGTYFGIFASAFVGLFLVLLILEQLEIPRQHLKLAVLLGPLILFGGISVAASTNNSGEFFAAGRRVPAVYNGLIFAVTTIGGIGLISLTGLFFLIGFDAWFMAIGVFAGFLIMGIVISPYLRKYGAYTVPTYLSRRFESRSLRLLAAMLFAVPLILLLAGELAIAVHAAGELTELPHAVIVTLLGATITVTAVLGGMRGIGWVGTAQAIAALLAVIVLAGIIGVIMTNLPLAQLSYGPVLRHIARTEEAQQITGSLQGLLAFTLPGPAPETLSNRIGAPFGSVGATSFIMGLLTVMMGVAAAPWLLPRCATTLGVYEARKSLGWAIFFAGCIIITLSALAVFFRAIVMSELVGRTQAQLPGWFERMMADGRATVSGAGPELPLNAFAFGRDHVLFAVPEAMSLPDVAVYLVIAGAIAGALAAAGATAFALAAILAEDVYGGLRYTTTTATARLHTTRAMSVIVLLLALMFNFTISSDPLELFLMAIVLSAGTAFPVITLSIWWKRVTTAGAAVGMTVGFTLATLLIFAGKAGLVPAALPTAGFTAALAGAISIFAVSLLTPVPKRAAFEAVRDMRIPGGETVYDREMRQLRFRERART